MDMQSAVGRFFFPKQAPQDVQIDQVSKIMAKSSDLKTTGQPKWMLDIYSETSTYHSQMYLLPGSIVQFLWSLSESYLNYGNETRTNRSSIYRFPASIGQNF
jgi:hypothetical protein